MVEVLQYRGRSTRRKRIKTFRKNKKDQRNAQRKYIQDNTRTFERLSDDELLEIMKHLSATQLTAMYFTSNRFKNLLQQNDVNNFMQTTVFYVEANYKGDAKEATFEHDLFEKAVAHVLEEMTADLLITDIVSFRQFKNEEAWRYPPYCRIHTSAQNIWELIDYDETNVYNWEHITAILREEMEYSFSEFYALEE